MVGMKDKIVYVRGKWVSFSREQIDSTYNLQEKKTGAKFKRLVETPNYQKIVDLLIDYYPNSAVLHSYCCRF